MLLSQRFESRSVVEKVIAVKIARRLLSYRATLDNCPTAQHEFLLCRLVSKREVVESVSVEVFNNHLDTVLSNQPKMALLEERRRAGDLQKSLPQILWRDE